MNRNPKDIRDFILDNYEMFYHGARKGMAELGMDGDTVIEFDQLLFDLKVEQQKTSESRDTILRVHELKIKRSYFMVAVDTDLTYSENQLTENLFRNYFTRALKNFHLFDDLELMKDKNPKFQIIHLEIPFESGDEDRGIKETINAYEFLRKKTKVLWGRLSD